MSHIQSNPTEQGPFSDEALEQSRGQRVISGKDLRARARSMTVVGHIEYAILQESAGGDGRLESGVRDSAHDITRYRHRAFPFECSTSTQCASQQLFHQPPPPSRTRLPHVLSRLLSTKPRVGDKSMAEHRSSHAHFPATTFLGRDGLL